MITSRSDVIRGILALLSNQVTHAHASSLIVRVSGDIDSAVVAALCARSKTPTIGVIMSCPPLSSDAEIERASEVIRTFNVKQHLVDLSASRDSISRQFAADTPAGTPLDEPTRDAALRCCLQAPVLDYAAKFYNGLIVGTKNRDDYEIARIYHKRGDVADILPIAKLHKSEIRELALFLNVPDSVIRAESEEATKAKSDAESNGEVYSPGYFPSYDEIEWATAFAEKFSVIPISGNVRAHHLYSAMQNSSHFGVSLTLRETEILQLLQAREVQTRHKLNVDIPTLDLRLRRNIITPAF